MFRDAPPMVSPAAAAILGHPDRLHGIHRHRQEPGSHQRLRDRRHAGDAGAGHRQCGGSPGLPGAPRKRQFEVLGIIGDLGFINHGAAKFAKHMDDIGWSYMALFGSWNGGSEESWNGAKSIQTYGWWYLVWSMVFWVITHISYDFHMEPPIFSCSYYIMSGKSGKKKHKKKQVWVQEMGWYGVGVSIRWGGSKWMAYRNEDPIEMDENWGCERPT